MTATTTIIRAPHDKDHPYAVVAAYAAQDERLSLEARGALLYFLAKPDTWEINAEDLAKRGNCGRGRAYRILKELELAGYAVRTAVRNAAGQVAAWVTVIHEQPLHTDALQTTQPHLENPDVENPDVEKQDLDKQHIENPDVENRQHSKYRVQASINSKQVSTTTHAASTPAKHPEPVVSVAYAPGGGGADLKTETEAYLYRCGVKAKSKRRTLAARLTMVQIEQEWAALVALNAQRRAKGLVDLGGGHFADTLEALASAPADMSPPTANLPPEPKAPYLDAEWFTWTDQQRDDATEEYEAARRRRAKAIARTSQ